MTTSSVSTTRRMQAALDRRPRLRLAGLLALPMTWLVLLFLVPMVLLFITAFWTTDSFTGQLIQTFTFENFARVFDPSQPFLLTAARTLGVAVAVTVLSILLAVPVSLFVATVARRRWRPFLIALMITPLWASYLVKVYAWRTMLNPEGGFLESTLGFSTGYGWLAVVVVLTYLWLPYMILPVYVGIQNIPPSLLDASADLGARNWATIRRVLWPIVKPAIIAGSVFTFSLSLGDYITVQLVGGKAQMLGNVVYGTFATDLPFAAAIASLTVLIMVGYLTAVSRTGALESL